MQHYSNHRDKGYFVLQYAAIDHHRIKFFVDYHTNTIDDTPHQDGETTYVIERQAGKPTIVEVVPKIER